MARAQSLARAALLERPATAYIVPLRHEGEIVDIEVTREDLARDAAWAAGRLRALGLERGTRALLNFSGYEGYWFQPVIEALLGIGVTYGTAETMGWDNARTAVFLRDLDLAAVIGLSEETLEGLSGRTMLDEMFRDTPVVLARPAAARRLRAAGVAPGVISPLGPALAIECRERGGAHVNAAEWQVGERDGTLTIAAAGDRRGAGLGEVDLDIPGGVVTDPCPCGSQDPRVLFA